MAVLLAHLRRWLAPLQLTRSLADTSTFLALDLGGTNLRVCEVRLLGNHKFEMKQQKYKVSDDLKEGEAAVLFGEWGGARLGGGGGGGGGGGEQASLGLGWWEDVGPTRGCAICGSPAIGDTQATSAHAFVFEC